MSEDDYKFLIFSLCEYGLVGNIGILRSLINRFYRYDLLIKLILSFDHNKRFKLIRTNKKYALIKNKKKPKNKVINSIFVHCTLLHEIEAKIHEHIAIYKHIEFDIYDYVPGQLICKDEFEMRKFLKWYRSEYECFIWAAVGKTF